MNNQTEISDIFGQTSTASEEIVKKRMQDLSQNSIIWSIAYLYEKRNSSIDSEKLWTHQEIFSMERTVDNKKLHHSKKFNEIGVGDFTMKCLLCEFETKFFISSKSCPSMLLHAKEVH